MPAEVIVYTKNIDYITSDDDFNQNLNTVLDEFSKKQPFCSHSMGASITTCSDDKIFYQIDNKQYIINWLVESVLKYSKEKNKCLKKIDLRRSWCNRVFFDCECAPHNHYDPNVPYWDDNTQDLTVILYYEVPEDSSELIFIDSNQILESHSDYEESLKYHLPLEKGMTIVHPTNLIHSAPKLNSKPHRTCFVFDVTLSFLG